MTAVEVTDLCKSFGRHLALDHLSFKVAQGSIYGLIGPNGAGKTTTLSIMAGLVSPTSGQVVISGLKVRPNLPGLVSRVGFASPRYGYFDYLAGGELVTLCGLMHGLSSREAQRRSRDLMSLLDLEMAANHYLCHYSHGMRQKLGLACALVHAPDVVLLDEPFIGLDPVSIYRVFHTLRKMSLQGRTIVLTSHDLALVERLCDRVGILHDGVFKREFNPTRIDSGKVSHHPNGGSELESVLWEVVGIPEFKPLAWL
jgi:ABC-2 type transport system ATP-binding protein